MKEIMFAIALLCQASWMFQFSFAYNIDIRSSQVKNGSPGSRFGSSVTFHSSAVPITGTTGSILVGAPNANRTVTPFGNFMRPNEQPGAVYKCSILTERCSEVNMDSNTNAWWPSINGTLPGTSRIVDYFGPLYIRAHALFGHVVVSGGPGKDVLSCGPNANVFRELSTRNTDLGEDVMRAAGFCVKANQDLQSLTQVKFCYHQDFSILKAELDYPCHGGVSAAYNPDSTDPHAPDGGFIIGGAYGSLAPQGFFSPVQFAGDVTNVGTTDTLSVSADGQASVSAIGVNHIPDHNDWDFTLGDHAVFYGGSPRGKSVKGDLDLPVGFVNVVQLSYVLGSVTELAYSVKYVGEQANAGYGSALVVGKFDNNFGSDLVVGAPYFSDFARAGNYDNGRIYFISSRHIQDNWVKDPLIYDTLGSSTFQGYKQSWTGDNRARLGFALANLGDTNGDGFDDVAVGAPGIDTVYIYHGRPEGLSSDHAQVIRASEINGGNFAGRLEGFGSAIGTTQFKSAPWDMDGNGYADLVVGAPLSDAVVYLKSRPVVPLTMTINVSSRRINFTKCLSRRDQQICFSGRVCFVVNTTSAPIGILPISASLSVCEATSAGQCLVSGHRLVFNSSTPVPNPVTFSTSKPSFCFNIAVNVKKAARDRLSPIHLAAKSSLIDSGTTSSVQLTPVMSPFSFALAPVEVQNNCVSVPCQPDVYIGEFNIEWMGVSTEYIVAGQDTAATVTVSVANRRESATAPVLRVVLPSGVKLVSLPRHCNLELGKPNTLACPLSNPFVKNTIVTKNFSISLDGIAHTANQLHFSAEATSDETSTPDVNHADNIRMLSISVRRRAGYLMSGVFSEGRVITLPNRDTVQNVVHIEDFGPVVSHWFSLINYIGPSTLPMTRVRFEYPSVVKNTSNHVLYLAAVQSDGESITCNLHGLVDPLNLGSMSVTTYSAISSDTSLLNEQDCTNGSLFYCTRRFECTFGAMARGDTTSLQLTWRLNNRTVLKYGESLLGLSPSFRVVSVAASENFNLDRQAGQSPTAAFYASLSVRSINDTHQLHLPPQATISGDSSSVWTLVGTGIAVLIALFGGCLLMLEVCGRFNKETQADSDAESSSTPAYGGLANQEIYAETFVREFVEQ